MIAHQSTIPHYRIPFYNELQKAKPADWEFEVAFDPAEFETPRVFKEPIDPGMINFPIYPARLNRLRVGGKTVYYQSFWRRAAQSHLVVVENAVNNLAYPLVSLHRRRGVKVAYWGHGKDRFISDAKNWKQASEAFKLNLVRSADGFFAYTPGVARYLRAEGLAQERIFTINNTIDITAQRAAYLDRHARRSDIRRGFDLDNQRVLLFSGRLLSNKRIDFLLQAFQHLQGWNAKYTLLLVGSDGESFKQQLHGIPEIRYLGPVTDLDRIADLFTAADIYVITGSIGLGPLHAQCYDLPVVAIDSPHHGPEVEYLSPKASLMLDADVDPRGYALAVHGLFEEGSRLDSLRRNVWESIAYLTIENMAVNFIRGINAILGIS